MLSEINAKVFLTSVSLSVRKHGSQALKKLKQPDANRPFKISTCGRLSKNVYQFAKKT